MSRAARARYETKRRALVEQLAPTAPPCFSSRYQWLVYVFDAAASQRPGHAPGPLLFTAGEPVRFNPRMSFCNECTDRHEGAMKAAGKCQPTYLIKLAELAKEPA